MPIFAPLFTNNGFTMIFHSGVPEYPYLLRYLSFGAITRGKQSAFDHKYFSKKHFPAAAGHNLPEQKEPSIGEIHIQHAAINSSLDELLAASDTLTFLVIKNGKIAYVSQLS